MSGRTVGRITVGVIIASLVVFWIYVFVVAKPIHDELPDPKYAPAAQAICSDALTQLRNAGLIEAVAKTPQQRADLAERADEVLARQVERLKAIPPGDDTTRVAVASWLDDWDTWLRDRAAWVVKLRAGEDAPFLETQDKNGTPSSAALNIFARVNQMPDCATPLGI